MSVHRIERTETIAIPVEEAWDFFSRPANLARLTPASMGFRDVFLPDNDQIYPGMCIVHSVAPPPGIRLTWVTQILSVQPFVRFTDTQVKGPFSLWHHIHEFHPVQGGTAIRDMVYYELPLGLLGDMAHALFARKQILSIFDYRSRELHKIFG